jgi:hypothetical protein
VVTELARKRNCLTPLSPFDLTVLWVRLITALEGNCRED